jgi:indolepyruvate ferredoxin oxidoreductase alpha subunit
VIILDNRTTGMTGHQEHAATGKTLKNEPTYAVDLLALCKAVGVEDVEEINAFDIAALEKKLKAAVNGNTLTVIIAKAPCALLKGQKFPYYCEVSQEKCKNCGACMKIGCPAISKTAEGIKIDPSACNGCGLCASYCKFGAIEKVER